MAIRIIAGEWGGRRLRSTGGADLRPSSGRLREALFSILAPRIFGAAFLDLFAGTGAAGFEALSRGADRAVFVEGNRRLCDTLRRNAAELGAGGRVRVVRAEIPAALRDLEGRDGPFDLIFADPPYRWKGTDRLLRSLAAGSLAARGGWIVLEHADADPPTDPEGLLRIRREGYGDSALSIFEKPG